MKRTIISYTIFSLVFILFLIIECFAEKKIVPIYSPGAGGTAYFLGGGIATVVNKFVPEVQLMVEATGGTGHIVKFLEEKFEKQQEAFGLGDSKGVHLAWAGELPYKKKYKMLRAVTYLYGAGVNLVVPKKSPIKSYYGLKNHRVAVGAAGSGTAEISMSLIEAHGVTKGMYKHVWLGYKEVVEGLQDGSIDAGFISGAYPVPAITELSLAREITIVSVDDKVLKKLIEQNPYFSQDMLKPGSYKGVEKETAILVFGVLLETHSGSSTEAIYKITRALFEHRNQLIEIHPVAKEINLQSALKTIAIPLHPGAEKYFREVSVIKK